MLGVLVVYGLVNLLVAQGLSSGLSVSSAKSQLSSLFHINTSNFGGNLSVYGLMLASFGSSGSSSGSFGYSLILAVVASLAIIWTLRNASNNKKGSKDRFMLKEAYYRGMYPLIPFLIILLLIGIELLPMLAGISLYISAVNNSIAIIAIEKLGFMVILLLLSALSLFLISSSIFALYISTLPDMTPIKALRSAKDLVKYRRFTVLLRILYLPLALLIISALVMLPLIAWAPAAAAWVFLGLSLVMLALTHAYLYNLYRELLI